MWEGAINTTQETRERERERERERLTNDHERELKTSLDRLSEHLVGKVGKTYKRGRCFLLQV